SSVRPPPLPTLFPYTTLFRSWAPDGRIRSIVDIRWPALRRFLLMFLPTLAAAALAPGLVQWLEPALHRTMQVVLPSWWDLDPGRSEEHTSELQSRENLVCRLL